MTTLNRSCFVLALIAIAPACATIEDGPTKDELAAGATGGKADGFDWCAARDYYGDGECDRFCARHDEDCPLLGPEPTRAKTRYPIIIHHGFAGGNAGIFAYKGVAAALAADGNTVVQTTVPPFDSIAVRSAVLEQIIDDTLRTTGAAKVNIIAHSMGGLDARYLIATLGYGDRVASLTTISTPHRGTRGGDLGLRLIPHGDAAVNALAGILGEQISGTPLSVNVRAALTDLSVAEAPARNSATPDDSRVYYQSWAGVSSVLGLASEGTAVEGICEGKLEINRDTFDRMRLAFVPLDPVIGSFGADAHDGLVTVASAKWGNFKGCIPADHSDEVGQVTTATPNPKTDWDPARFYRQVADDLAARGF
jgi:triacylglycerol lipase